MHTASGRGLMRLSIKAVLAAEPTELSLLHWLFYIATGGGLDSLIRTTAATSRTDSSAARRRSRSGWPTTSATGYGCASPVRRIENEPSTRFWCTPMT